MTTTSQYAVPSLIGNLVSVPTIRKKVSMTRNCHNQKSQTTNPWQHEKETPVHRQRYTHRRKVIIKVKQPVLSSSAGFLQKREWTQMIISQNKNQIQPQT